MIQMIVLQVLTEHTCMTWNKAHAQSDLLYVKWNKTVAGNDKPLPLPTRILSLNTSGM